MTCNVVRELRKLYLDAWRGGDYKDLEKGGEAFICSVRLRDWEGMQHVSCCKEHLA